MWDIMPTSNETYYILFQNKNLSDAYLSKKNPKTTMASITYLH